MNIDDQPITKFAKKAYQMPVSNDRAFLYEQIDSQWLAHWAVKQWLEKDRQVPEAWVNKTLELMDRPTKVDKRKDWDVQLKHYRIWRACIATAEKFSISVYSTDPSDIPERRWGAIDYVAEAIGSTSASVNKMFRSIQNLHAEYPYMILSDIEEAKLQHMSRMLEESRQPQTA